MILRFTILLFLLFIGFTSFSQTQNYSLKLNNKNVGSVSIKSLIEDVVFTTSKTEMTIVTLDDTIKVDAIIKYKEDSKGQLIDVYSQITLPNGQLAKYNFQNNQYKDIPIDSSQIVIGPYGAQLLSKKELKQLGDTIKYKSYSPDLHQITRYTRTVTDIKFIHAQKCRLVDEYSDQLPTSHLLLDANYELLSSDFTSPLGTISIRKSAPQDSIITLYNLSLSNPKIRSNAILPDPANINALEVEIIYQDTALVTRITDNSFNPTPTDSVEFAKARYSNAWILSDSLELFSVADSLTIKLSNEKAMVDTLFNYCKHDTTEYPVIQLVTMVRSLGILGRIVKGYYYQTGYWTPSYWAQIGIDGEWIDYHFGYELTNQALTIPISTSYLENGFTPLSSQVPKQIKVTSILSKNSIQQVYQSKPYLLENNRLKFSAIKLSILTPNGFKIDSTYLDENTLIQLKSQDQKIIIKYYPFKLGTTPIIEDFINSIPLDNPKKNNQFKFDHLMIDSTPNLLIVIPQGDSFIVIRGINLKAEVQQKILNKKSIQLR